MKKTYKWNPYTNLPLKQKLLLNMALALIGFYTISSVAILSNSQILALVVVNLTFTVLIIYANWAAYVRIKGGITRFKKYMSDLMDFVFMRTNAIEKAKFMKNDEIGMILTEMNQYVDQIDNIRKEY